MSRPAPPALTVRYDGSTRSFAPGNDVVVGRDLRADVRIAHPLISRAHLVLRFDQGRWVAIDNGSLNGMYVNNRRMPSVDIQDGQRLNIGNPDGPQLTFEVGRHQGAAGRTPTQSVPISPERGGDTSWPTQGPRPSPTCPSHRYHGRRRPRRAGRVRKRLHPDTRPGRNHRGTRRRRNRPRTAAGSRIPPAPAPCGNPRYRSRYRNRHSSR